ncbi:DUF6088 family protein [Photobacterium leiognathi]|uniref:DUF6088 family protein n=1 Tax=Photobacterium leiognathi TaxID=553611 RepID=UPI002981AB3A|nr:DUF6088 family protein [Photobacterium leiognathi]
MVAEERILTMIRRSKKYVFERKNFYGVASYSHVGRCLTRLVLKGQLMKIGYGLYTKARINSLTGELMPSHPGGVDGIVREVLILKNVDFELDKFSMLYLSGKTTQVPASFVYSWPQKQFNRKLIIAGHVIQNPK